MHSSKHSDKPFIINNANNNSNLQVLRSKGTVRRQGTHTCMAQNMVVDTGMVTGIMTTTATLVGAIGIPWVAWVVVPFPF
jgi:hypothetical protein